MLSFNVYCNIISVGASRRNLGHENGGLINETSTFQKKPFPERLLPKKVPSRRQQVFDRHMIDVYGDLGLARYQEYVCCI